MSCKQPEPAPQQFFAPADCFTALEQKQLGVEVLGDCCYSPGFSFRYEIVSGPLCRIYLGNGKVEPWGTESCWEQLNGKWRKNNANYLSYRLENGQFVTVRWRQLKNRTHPQSRILDAA